MPSTYPNESPEYRAARNALLEQEIALRRQTEAVAAARRALPPGGDVTQDYVFTVPGPGGASTPARLADLFTAGQDTLAVYHFMYGPRMAAPCPMCSLLLDGVNGASASINGRIAFVVNASSPLPRILEAAQERGWDALRFVSSAGTTFNRDYLAENAQGDQLPMLNVFQRDGDTIRHVWGSELFYAPTEPGQDTRHVDSLIPLWNMFDFVPEGRGA